LSRTLGEQVEISLDLSPDVWPIIVDPAQLQASLTNLATNARDAMPHGGRLMILTGNRHLDDDFASEHAEVISGHFVMIEVSDTGVGMMPEVMNRIFEPFFTIKERDKGTGLGLSMVFGFIKQSGGHISVYSEPGKGTTFRLFLPRMTEDVSIVETSFPVELVRGRAKQFWSSRTIPPYAASSCAS
jgi:signal transduction histidine kinase